MTTSDDSLADVIRRAVQSAAVGDGRSIADAVLRVPANAIAVFLHANFTAEATGELLTTAIGASPGAASGVIVLDTESAIAAADDGRAVILVRRETTPDDVLGMKSARGIVTTCGGTTSHAAVVARGWGIPAVVGAGEVVIDEQGLRIGGRFIPAGTEISINGGTGEVFLGAAEATTMQAPAELDTLLNWADQIRHAADVVVAVRANADNVADADHARRLGAEGIGLCRTEHMFLAADRLPLIRRFILTDDPTEERDALGHLEAAQQIDFEGILTTMDGLPVTIRLLDPPLHEFLPDVHQLIVAEALGLLDSDGQLDLAAVRRLHEVNPMIGTRGFRLGVAKPGLYQMQVRALLRAVAAVAEQGVHAIVEVLIPLVVDPSEMRVARKWVAEAAKEVGFDADVSVGAMLETPRSALLAGDLAAVSDFFSFGTNDLTQFVFAFSRDDAASRLIPAYLRMGLLEKDPFESLDQDGVGRLIRFACEQARDTNPAVKLGVCGEQAGDPESVKFLVRCGVDYVSCSPYRVPVARLAVAQALLENNRVTSQALANISRTLAPAIVLNDHVSSAARPSESTDLDAPHPTEPHDFLVMHALRIKGFAGVDTVADIAGVAVADVQVVLSELADRGMCRHIEGRDLWQLTIAGRSRHGELLLRSPEGAADGLRPFYEPFLELNVQFKDLCNRWQMKGDELNDHSDEGFDRARIAELRQMNSEAAVLLGSFTNAIRRFARYERRLAGALALLEGGETRMFTGVMCGSYHDVWMEWHEDLVQLLGVNRAAEGSY